MRQPPPPSRGFRTGHRRPREVFRTPPLSAQPSRTENAGLSGRRPGLGAGASRCGSTPGSSPPTTRAGSRPPGVGRRGTRPRRGTRRSPARCFLQPPAGRGSPAPWHPRRRLHSYRSTAFRSPLRRRWPVQAGSGSLPGGLSVLGRGASRRPRRCRTSPVRPRWCAGRAGARPGIGAAAIRARLPDGVGGALTVITLATFTRMPSSRDICQALEARCFGEVASSCVESTMCPEVDL